MSSSDDENIVAEYLRRLDTAAAMLPPDRRAELIDEITTHITEARAAQQDPAAGTDETVAAMLNRLGSPEDIVRAAAEQGSTGGMGPGGIGSGFGPEGHGRQDYSQHGYGGWAGGPPGWQPSQPYSESGGGLPPVRQGLSWLEVFAIVLLLVGGFLAGIGWIVGVIFLWLSPRWRLSDKLLGTLVWPGGLAGVILVLSAAALFPASSSGCGASGQLSEVGANSPAGATGQLVATCGAAGPPAWLSALLAIAVVLVGVGGPILVTTRLVRQARRWASEPGGTTAAQSL